MVKKVQRLSTLMLVKAFFTGLMIVWVGFFPSIITAQRNASVGNNLSMIEVVMLALKGV